MIGYTVTERQGCRIVTGPIPITDMVALMNAWRPQADDDDTESDPAQEWIVDAELSQRLGATLVCGPRLAVQRLRAALDNGVHGA